MGPCTRAADEFVNHGCAFIGYALLYTKLNEGPKKVLRAVRTVGYDNAGQCILGSLEALDVSVGIPERAALA